MALVFMEGFDLTNGYSYRSWVGGGSASALSYQAGVINGSCLRMQTTLSFGQPDNL